MLDHPLSAERMGQAGFDFLVIDTQHGHSETGAVLPLVQAAGGHGTPVLARVAWEAPHLIMRALDLGAEGVIVPMTSTAAAVRDAVRAARYAPLGERSYGPIRASFPTTDAANETVLVIPMIETREAIDNIEAICDEPGVDGLFIGPYDLGLVMGVPPADVPTNRELLETMAHVVDVASERGVFVGSVSSGRAHVEALLGIGIRFISLGSDLTFVQEGARQRVALRTAVTGMADAGVEGPRY